MSTKHQADLEIFIIFDTKTNSYGTPAFSKNQFTLIREMEQMLKDPAQSKNQLVTNAEDFQIFRVANYDQKTGKMETWQPEHIANVHQIQAGLA